MPSKIADVYAQLNTSLPVYFPTHKKMVDPQNVDSNDKFILNKGYGFYVSSGANTQRTLNCAYSIERQIVIVLSIVNRGTERDISIRENAEIALLEDQHILIKNVEADVDLNSKVGNFAYQGDGGLEYLVADEQRFIVVRSNFACEYFESLA